MSSYEDTFLQNKSISCNKQKSVFEKSEISKSKTIKSLDYLIDQSQTIMRHAEKINASSTKVFIESFLFNINEIRSRYKIIESYFKSFAELNDITVKKNQDDNSLANNISEKISDDEENKSKNIYWKMNTKSELEDMAAEITSKSDAIKNDLHNIKFGISKNFAVRAYKNFESLNNAILRLDSIENIITAYSE
jgi:hypothetical protein